MDLANIIAVGGSFVLSIGVVAAFLGKVLPKMEKYIHVAKDALALLDDATVSLKDGKITPEEITQLESDIQGLKDALKS